MNNKPDPEMIDNENPELTDAMFARARPAVEVHPELVAESLCTRGQQKLPVKVATSIRLSQEVIEYFKRDGKGWQTRLDNFLCDAIAREKRKAG